MSDERTTPPVLGDMYITLGAATRSGIIREGGLTPDVMLALQGIAAQHGKDGVEVTKDAGGFWLRWTTTKLDAS